MDEDSPLIEKIGQGYQVIGSLRGGVKPTEAEWQRVLDYFADEARFDPDFLPWPYERASDAQAPK